MWTCYGRFFKLLPYLPPPSPTLSLCPSHLCPLPSLQPFSPCLCVLPTSAYSPPSSLSHPVCVSFPPLPTLLPPASLTLKFALCLRGDSLGQRMLNLSVDGDSVYRHPLTQSHVGTGIQREAPQNTTSTFCSCLLNVRDGYKGTSSPSLGKATTPPPSLLPAPDSYSLSWGTCPSCAPLPGGEQGFTVR